MTILFPSSSATPTRIHLVQFKKALDENNMAVPMVTTNLFTHPVFKDGVHVKRSGRPSFRDREDHPQYRSRRDLGAQIYVCWGGREGAEIDAAKDVRVALDRYKEAFDVLGQYVVDQGYDIKFAIEPKPNEPRGDILLPTVGSALAFIQNLERPELVGVNPETGTNRWRTSILSPLSLQALWHDKLFHVDLNGQHGPKYDQDLVFGHGDLINAFFLVDLLEHAGYDGPRHFDYKPMRTEDMTGVWESAAANMRTYLMLKERAAAFRADPEVRAAMAASGWGELAEPTLAANETYRDLPPWQMLTQTSWRSVGTVTCDSTSWRSNTSSAPVMTLVAGVDSSTQSCKVVIRELETGTIVRSGPPSHPDGTEADPEAWWNALQLAVRNAGGLGDVAAVGIGGQQHGMVCLDVAGNVVRPALLWNDTRSAAAASDLVSELGAQTWAQAVGSVPVAAFTVSKLRWLARHEPMAMAKTAAVCLPHDWLTWGLIGGEAANTGDRSRGCKRHRLLVTSD